jgi:hypothetical protein
MLVPASVGRAALTVVHDVADCEAARTAGVDETRGAVAVCLRPGVAGERLLVTMTHEAGDGVGAPA